MCKYKVNLKHQCIKDNIKQLYTHTHTHHTSTECIIIIIILKVTSPPSHNILFLNQARDENAKDKECSLRG